MDNRTSVAVPPGDPAGPEDEGSISPSLRLATRLSTDYVIRFLALLRDLGPGDLIDTLISMALVQANVGHIDGATPPAADALRSDGAVPDNLRRPVSVLALSDALGLPYETTRRRVAQLVAGGYCTRVPGGVIVPVATDSDTHHAIRTANFANLQRMFRALRLAGVSLD